MNTAVRYVDLNNNSNFSAVIFLFKVKFKAGECVSYYFRICLNL